MVQQARIDFLINYLLKENPSYASDEKIKKHASLKEKIKHFRALCNIRQVGEVSDEFLAVQDEFLTEWNEERGTVAIDDLEKISDQLYLWQGDITRLKVDAIVNAANSELLGCRVPNHQCIDNIIHTRAGVQLRNECHDIIESQKRKEPVGKAKLTSAYNLPATYIIHTVGPYIDERGVSPLRKQLLASSYKSCLKLADQHQLKHIAFCCIATGEFNFPKELAAEIAIETVTTYIEKTNSPLQVIFNVYSAEDLAIYQSLLKGHINGE